jgi:nucleoid-associated protein EbfC
MSEDALTPEPGPETGPEIGAESGSFDMGGFDMGALLAQAQQMQQQLQDAQRSLAEATAEGSAGNGAIAVTVSGVGELRSVVIAPGVFDTADEESLVDLGDLIVAAYRDAKAKADTLASDTLGPMGEALSGGFPDLGAGLGG